MPDFVADKASLPAAKTDFRPLGSNPATKYWAALDANATFDALRSLRSVTGQTFSPMAYGAVGDGVADDTDALEAALTAAGAAVQNVGGLALAQPRVVIPAGGYLQSRPLFLPGGVTVRGDGPGSTVLCWRSGYWGYGLLAADADDGVESVHVSGGMLHCDYDNAISNTKTFVDLAQYPGGRLPAGSWTIRVARRFSDVAASAAGALPILFVGATTPWSEQPILSTALNLHFDPFALDGSLRIALRFGNVANEVTVATASYGALANGTWYEFELDYDDSAGTLRVFVNGELWTRGAWVPPGGAGDGTKFRQWVWERFTVGSATGGFFPSEGILFATATGDMKGFHVSNGVRHTSGYTAAPLTDPTPDGSTRLLLTFASTYKGHLVAKGIGGTPTVYLKPVRQNPTEHPRVQVCDLTLLAGAGLRTEFASEGRFSNLIVSYPDAGVELMRNGYFTHLSHVRVLNGSRAGFLDEGGAYQTFLGLNSSCPIGFGLTATNAALVGCESAARGGAAVNLSIDGGAGSTVSFAVDNEENVGSTPWAAALVLKNTSTWSHTDATIYNPPDKRAAQSPILIQNTLTPDFPTTYNFVGGLIPFVPADVPLAKLVGNATNLVNKINFAGTSNPNGSPLCNVAGQAQNPFASIWGQSGQTAIGDFATTVTVTLPAGEVDNQYYVAFSLGTLTGTPTFSTPFWTADDKLPESFVIHFPSAPGAGNTILVGWALFRVVA